MAKRVHILAYLVLILSLWGCMPPESGGIGKLPEDSPAGELLQDLVSGAQELTVEFQELAKPDKVEAWVDQLIVKAQPGKDMPEVARLREGEVATYLKQRTLRKAEYTLRGQRYYEPWILIKTQDSIMGWVHQGGVRFVQPNLLNLIEGSQPAQQIQTRSMEPNARTTPTATDHLIIPGKQVGDLTLNTTEASLISKLGPEKVTRGSVQTSSVNIETATVLYAGTPEEIRITWKSEERQKIKAIYLNKFNSPWRLATGLQVGISMLDLTKINEAPVNFYGFNWEYAGVVNSYRNGRLAKYEKYFYLVLAPRRPKAVNDLLSKYNGDKLFTSNSEGVEQLDLIVERIVVYLD